jgi:hypothetical protein
VKPLPEAVQAAFPCKPNRIPSRPWWVLLGEMKTLWGREWPHKSFSRTDDRTAAEPSPRNLLGVEETDAQNPLPHPGFRAGQVWANDKGHSVIVLAVGEGIVVTKQGEWHRAELNRTYPYLMADPACPWLAPWSPSEEKTP